MILLKKDVDLTGSKYYKLFVESRAEDSAKGRDRWNCVCECGKTKTVLGYNLRNGNTKSCGCYQQQRSSESKIKDIIGKKYNSLTILKRVDKLRVLCKCDCGKEIVVRYSNLISNNTTSCGHLKSQNASKRLTIDLTGKKYGELTVIKRISPIGKLKNPEWLCKCSCGIYTIVNGQKLREGRTRSCGHLKHSLPESIIVHYLKVLGIKYTPEYMYNDLLSEKGYPLRFDFKIITDTGYFLLEYQGEQHYRECDDDFGKQQREVTDKQKKEYCKANNIELIEIRYDENIVESLMQILKDHKLLHDNPVPSVQNSA